MKNLQERIEGVNISLDAFSMISLHNKRGNIEYVNEKFLEISKYGEKELLGQSFNVLDSDFHSETFFKDLLDTVEKGHIWHGEVKNKAKDLLDLLLFIIFLRY